MTWIRQSLQHRLVARGATAIFRRASSLTARAGDAPLGIAGDDFLKYDIMSPIVTKVIQVDHSVAGTLKMLHDRHLPACEHLSTGRQIIVDWYSYLPVAVTALAVSRKKRVQMVIEPTHGILNGDVQIPEGVVVGHFYFTPDRRCDVPQLDSKPKNRPFHRVFNLSSCAIIH